MTGNTPDKSKDTDGQSGVDRLHFEVRAGAGEEGARKSLASSSIPPRFLLNECWPTNAMLKSATVPCTKAY